MILSLERSLKRRSTLLDTTLHECTGSSYDACHSYDSSGHMNAMYRVINRSKYRLIFCFMLLVVREGFHTEVKST